MSPAPSQQPNPHNPDLPYFETETLQPADFDSAQEQFVTVVNIPCSAKNLFSIFEDADSWPKWVPGIGGVQWTSEKPFAVGTTRTVFFWGGMEVYEEFGAWEDDRKMAFTFTGITQPVWTCFGELYEVEPQGENDCQLTWTVAYTPRDVFAKIHFMVRPLMGLTFRLYMNRLKAYAKRYNALSPSTSVTGAQNPDEIRS
jgi:hypothetical protein